MAKKSNKTEEQFSQVESNMSKSAIFIQNNQKQIVLGFGIIVLLVLAFPLVKSIFTSDKDDNLQANDSMMESVYYLNIDSIYYALYGYGNSEGLVSISQNNDINISYLYTAIAHRELKQYEEALSIIDKFSLTNDKHINSMYYGIKGDCYYGIALMNENNDTIKKENLNEAIEWYDLASTKYVNAFSTPLYMFRMASIYNNRNEYSKALDIYNKIKIEYPNSYQAKNSEYYISEINNR